MELSHQREIPVLGTGDPITSLDIIDIRAPESRRSQSEIIEDWAAFIRGGQVQTYEDRQLLAEAASHIFEYTREEDGREEVVYTGSDGSLLDPGAAAFVRRMGQPGKLEETVAFLDPKWETELDVPSGNLKKVAETREWLGDFLGLANPYRYTVAELRELARMHPSLYPAEGRAWQETQSVVEIEPESETPEYALGNEDQRHFEPAPSTGQQPRKSRTSPANRRKVRQRLPDGSSDASESPLIPASLPRQRKPGKSPINPKAPAPRRPDDRAGRAERPAKRRSRLRKFLGTAALATALAATTALGIQVLDRDDSQPPQGSAAIAELPAQGQPLAAEKFVQRTKPDNPARGTEESETRNMTMEGEYSPGNRTGAIWFMVEDYAAELGHDNLTLNQAYQLTDRTLKFMDKHMENGMSWQKARALGSGAQLPFPPKETMREWLTEIAAS